jgi:hypothetical protein
LMRLEMATRKLWRMRLWSDMPRRGPHMCNWLVTGCRLLCRREMICPLVSGFLFVFASFWIGLMLRLAIRGALPPVKFATVCRTSTVVSLFGSCLEFDSCFSFRQFVAPRRMFPNGCHHWHHCRKTSTNGCHQSSAVSKLFDDILLTY